MYISWVIVMLEYIYPHCYLLMVCSSDVFFFKFEIIVIILIFTFFFLYVAHSILRIKKIAFTESVHKLRNVMNYNEREFLKNYYAQHAINWVTSDKPKNTIINEKGNNENG